MTLFSILEAAEWMSHGSELLKVTSVYLETAEPIDWNSTMKVCAMVLHRIAYWHIHCTGCGGVGEISPPLGGAAKFWPNKTPILRFERL